MWCMSGRTNYVLSGRITVFSRFSLRWLNLSEVLLRLLSEGDTRQFNIYPKADTFPPPPKKKIQWKTRHICNPIERPVPLDSEKKNIKLRFPSYRKIKFFCWCDHKTFPLRTSKNPIQGNYFVSSLDFADIVTVLTYNGDIGALHSP